MITRLWRGWVSTQRAEDYVAYVEGTGGAGYRATPGNVAAQTLIRDLGDGRTEVLTLSWWESMRDIAAFAGDDIEQARFYPEDDDFLVDRETTVAHYEVRTSAGAMPADLSGVPMAAGHGQPRMYSELASWFHLLTAPTDYVEEAAQALRLLTEATGAPPHTILELGSGGGNNASHMKAHATLTLTDVSPEMLALSRTLNPECEHLVGDMRTLRLGRTFDAVFVHDAVSYLTSEDDLAAAIATAYAHCRPGGAALFAPDAVTERFRPSTDTGGHDGTGDEHRALRYLEWTWDPDPDDTWYVTDYAYLLRHHGDRPAEVRSDRHILGLFPRATWLSLLADAGFVAETRLSVHDDEADAELFLARRS